jgi:hypothetical protein
MSHLDGLPIEEIRRRVGDLRQVARIERFVEDDGPARGSRRYRVVTGGGLEFDVHPDRCLDIGAISYMGTPLAWIAPRDTGPARPARAGALGWQRAFAGGLFTTCGLDQFGSPCEDGGEPFGLHGRIGGHSAVEVSAAGDGRELVISGQVRQSRLFGENLALYRTIRTPVGGGTVEVLDTVVNEGFSATPHMILYHLNLGWPLVDESAVLEIPGTAVVPRDPEARRGLASWHAFGPPQRHWREQVFRHDLPAGSLVEVRLVSRHAGLAIQIDSGALPWLFQWKMLGEGTYVLGLEPANCPVIEGRARAREAGVLPTLAPGERREYRMTFSALPGKSIA